MVFAFTPKITQNIFLIILGVSHETMFMQLTTNVFMPEIVSFFQI